MTVKQVALPEIPAARYLGGITHGAGRGPSAHTTVFSNEGGDVGVQFSKLRVWLDLAVTVVAGLLGILTIFWRDWIEALTGWDPDHHTGSTEWAIVAALLIAAIAMGFVTHYHWKCLRVKHRQLT